MAPRERENERGGAEEGMVCVQGQREGSKYGKKMQTSKINR